MENALNEPIYILNGRIFNTIEAIESESKEAQVISDHLLDLLFISGLNWNGSKYWELGNKLEINEIRATLHQIVESEEMPIDCIFKAGNLLLNETMNLEVSGRRSFTPEKISEIKILLESYLTLYNRSLFNTVK